MKACFLNLPWEEDNRRGIRAGCRFPNLQAKHTNSYVPFPFLLAYAASYSQLHGAQAMCIDGIAERCPLTSVIQRVRAFAPDLVVAETSTTSLAHDLAALAAIKRAAPATRIALYGPHVHERAEDGLREPAVEFVLRGEPEATSLELLRTICSGRSGARLSGVIARDGEGLVAGPDRPLIHDIDSLPYPMREGMPLTAYNVPGFPPPVMFIYGSRGCPYPCTFCLWPQTMLKGNYRMRAGEKIAEEIAWVLEHYPQTRSFFFDDDTFNLGRERCLRFAAEMERRKLRVPWGMNARADNWDRELMERLVRTGLFTIRVGVESGDPDVLSRTKKGITLDQVRATLKLAHSLGVRNHVSFMIGLPGETERSVDNTIRFIKSVPVDSVQFSVAIPFPGTSLFREVEQRGLLLSSEWPQFNGFDHVVARTDEMTIEAIHRAIDRARRSVYLSPRFILRRLSYIRDFRDLSALVHKALRLVTPWAARAQAGAAQP
jgi:radical SAM superfamily enzyme YgiQ (UPF0313 family)